MFSLEHRSANQYHVNIHSTAITMSSRYREATEEKQKDSVGAYVAMSNRGDIWLHKAEQ